MEIALAAARGPNRAGCRPTRSHWHKESSELLALRGDSGCVTQAGLPEVNREPRSRDRRRRSIEAREGIGHFCRRGKANMGTFGEDPSQPSRRRTRVPLVANRMQ